MILKKCVLEDKHPNCKFRDKLGRCYILNSTYFENHTCPFYKVLKEGEEAFDPNKIDYSQELLKNE